DLSVRVTARSTKFAVLVERSAVRIVTRNTSPLAAVHIHERPVVLAVKLKVVLVKEPRRARRRVNVRNDRDFALIGNKADAAETAVELLGVNELTLLHKQVSVSATNTERGKDNRRGATVDTNVVSHLRKHA